jgi:sialic acid synthase SpsE
LSTSFRIDDIPIGTGRTFVIAEVGSNHGGDLSSAKEHIDAAAETGADAVKFQSLRLDRLWYHPNPDLRALHARIDFPEAWHAELHAYAEARGLLFSSSPTYLEAVGLMQQLGVTFFKIASAQVGTFPQLVRAVAATGRPAFFSSGIAGYAALTAAVQTFRQQANHQFGIFHCNSLYPTPPEAVNLGRMALYRQMFRCPVGFSDHTDGTSVVLGAVALGADMIEKHFRIHRAADSPDAPFSLLPDDFRRMVEGIRVVEAARRDDPRLELESAEAEFRDAIRYRLVMRTDKAPGDTLSPSDFDYLRSAQGIDVAQEPLVCDRFVASGPLKRGELLHWASLRGTQ